MGNKVVPRVDGDWEERSTHKVWKSNQNGNTFVLTLEGKVVSGIIVPTMEASGWKVFIS